jgi:hypothetical protein
MSYEKLLTDRCDIYHLKSCSPGGNWGIPTEDMQQETYYDDEPDVIDVKAYFTEKNQSITQGEPNAVITQSYLVHFLVSADIQTGSKVIWDGVSYKAQKPRKIKNHHQEVTLIRSDNL